MTNSGQTQCSAQHSSLSRLLACSLALAGSQYSISSGTTRPDAHLCRRARGCSTCSSGTSMSGFQLLGDGLANACSLQSPAVPTHPTSGGSDCCAARRRPSSSSCCKIMPASRLARCRTSSACCQNRIALLRACSRTAASRAASRSAACCAVGASAPARAVVPWWAAPRCPQASPLPSSGSEEGPCAVAWQQVQQAAIA